ncbi:unnamed protein product [Mytilus coruscus]|uniref:Tesmin/TSO1-like CXC domain-containing protein n=1 Tax=Mytilus coruscus TaxID=42192 RepID=A0A6J8E7Z9_MYTCO|nr:unnamed protein product [Mytilus coruscus]
MASTVSAESRKNKQEQSLEDAVQILKNYVKIYVSDKIKMDGLPDIDNFKCKDEILKIPPILWNFIFRICSTDNEEKVLKKSQFTWNSHYSEPLFNIFRMMPRLLCSMCWKDRSGFHGTTIQTVVPKPSQKINMFDDSNLISNLNQTNIEHDISEVKNSRDRKLEKNIIQKLVNPEDKFGLPPVKKQNKFSNMSPSDLDETSAEISEWDEFYTSVTKYGFSKNFFKKENIVLPGIKTFFSIPVETTEKSDFSSVAILDETADSKETVLKVLNILNDKFQVGQLTNYVVVVGDGKSYDHLIKLKSEYGENMDWYLPTLIYFDAGLKQLATKHHHGATLKVLTECSKFAITHRFFIQAWEAVMRHQVKSFFEYKSCESPYDIQVSDLILDIISDMSLDEGEDDVCKTDVWEKVPKAPVSSKTTVIIDGMFIINTSPLASHQTFGDYGEFLFNRWIIKYYNQYTANEVHLLFDDPNRNGVSPKDIEKNAENTVVQEPVVPGGFDDDRKDRAISILNGQVVDYDLASGNHEEADTRVWLHASVTTADQVIIYSPDTDGIDSIFDMYAVTFLSIVDVILCHISEVVVEDFFFDVFRKHASFIVGNGSFADVHGHNGLHSFYRLICSVYFNKHRAAFQPYSTPKSLFDSISEGDLHEKHLSFISAIREKLWERVVTEVEMMPNHEALKLHWMRCCWVFDYWSQSTSNTHTLSELSKSGWQITDNRLEIVWDTVLNFQKVEKTVEWYTKGCGCKTGCKTNRCKCKKAQNENCDGFCGQWRSVLDMSIDLDDVISDETEDLEDPVEDEQPEVDGLVEELDQTDDYWLFSNEEI